MSVPNGLQPSVSGIPLSNDRAAWDVYLHEIYPPYGAMPSHEAVPKQMSFHLFRCLRNELDGVAIPVVYRIIALEAHLKSAQEQGTATSSRLDANVTDLTARIHSTDNTISSEVAAIKERLSSLETRMTQAEALHAEDQRNTQASVESTLQRIETLFANLSGKIDQLDARLAVVEGTNGK